MMSMLNPESEKKRLILRLIFPDREPIEVICDSVKFTLRDNVSEKDGGLYGVHPGHSEAVFALAQGRAEALLDGKGVLKQYLGEGFAKVGKDYVTLITSPAEN